MSSNDHTNDAAPSRPPTDWGRVADGVFLAGLGVFFLVATTRGLPDGFWLDAVSLWPVLLVSAGIRIIFEKTALAAGVVLGPLVVLSTLFWLAWGTPPTPLPPGEWHALSAVAPEGTKQARIEGDVNGVQVSLETRSLPPLVLAQGRAASRETTAPRLRVDEGEHQATARLEGRQGGIMMIGSRREVWEVGVTDSLPLEVDLTGVFIHTQADLRTGHLTHAQLGGAFNAASLRLPRPSAPVTIQLEAAFSAFDVTVPEGTPTRVSGNGFPLNYVDRGPAQEELSDDEPGYTIVLDGAFCVLNVEEGPPPEGGWPPLPPVREPRVDDGAAGGGVSAPAGSEGPAPAEAPPPAEAGSVPASPPEDPSGG